MWGGGARKAVFDYDINSFGAFWGPERGGALFNVKIEVFWHRGSPGSQFRFYNKKRALAPSFKKAWFSATGAPLGLNVFSGTGAPLGHHFGCVGALFYRKTC